MTGMEDYIMTGILSLDNDKYGFPQLWNEDAMLDVTKDGMFYSINDNAFASGTEGIFHHLVSPAELQNGKQYKMRVMISIEEV